MPTLSINIPLQYCLLRKEYLYNLEDHFGEFIPCSVFGVTSIPARAITFSCMINNGAQVARLPNIDCETKPDYKVNEHIWKCEGRSKWYTEDSDKYFYDIVRGKD